MKNYCLHLKKSPKIEFINSTIMNRNIKFKESFKILVISLDKKYRSKSLLDFLDNYNLNSAWIPAIFLKHRNLRNNHIESTLYFDRISQAESSVSLSHIKARSEGLISNFDWILILEDDVIISEPEKLMSTLNWCFENISTFDPVAISFFPPQFGIFKKLKENQNLLKVLKVPDYAVATLYSRSALEVCSQNINRQIGNIADWPTIIKKKLKWFATRDLFLNHPKLSIVKDNSAVQAQRLIRQNYQSIYLRAKGRFIYLIFNILKLITKPYKGGFIASENLRSRVLWP